MERSNGRKNQTYIYTLPSDLEGMPLSLLEAMSYGNCCLVSDIPECAEVVEDKGMQYLSKLQEKMVMYEVDMASITRHNSNLLKPSKRGKEICNG